MQRSLILFRSKDQRVGRGKRKDIRIPLKEVDWLESLLKEVLV